MSVLSHLRIFRRASDDLAVVALRFGAGAMFLWFGMDKWAHPQAWFAWLPTWLPLDPVAAVQFMIAVGVVEFFIGLSLLAGRYLRMVSLLGLAALVIADVSVGISDVVVRDAAVAGSLLALAIQANARAKKPWRREIVVVACAIYVISLFLCGVVFLQAR